MRTNECRVNNVSVVCPAVRAGLASTMPARRLWGRHRFRHTPYGDDENVVDRVCTTRPPGTPAVATKMPLVSKPPPRQYLAHKVNVVNSVRVVCPAGEQQWRPRSQRHFGDATSCDAKERVMGLVTSVPSR